MAIAKMITKYKKIILLFLLFVLNIQIFTYAKKGIYHGEVDEPIGEPKSYQSEGVVIAEDPYKEYNPLNPVKPGINVDEYNSVDNYNIDLNTIETRIKYFSPAYTSIKSNAESMYWMAFYARGGNDTLLYNKSQYTNEIKELVDDTKILLYSAISKRNSLNPNDPNYERDYKSLTDIIDKSYRPLYNATNSAYNTAKKTINKTKSALGLSRALYNIGTVDNSNQVAFARREVTKNIKTLIMTYLQLLSYTDILEKQSKLYYDMYKLTLKNQDLGIATSYDVVESIDRYENAKANYKKTNTTLKNVKEQIAINLGYKISDLDKLSFVEPEVDLNYILSINFEEDKERAYTSNSVYTSISLNDKDRKLPGSTGEDILQKRQVYASNKVINEFEDIYNNLQSKILAYEGSLYLSQIAMINDGANKRKLSTNLISELEYKGLVIQNLGNILQVKTAKYDIINAANEYYYGALGHITLS